MSKSIFKFANKFGYESPFGDWLAERNQKNNVDEEPPKILDIDVRRDMSKAEKVIAIVMVKVTEKNFGKVDIEYDGKSKIAKKNILSGNYEAAFEIKMKNYYYENCLFEVQLSDSRDNIVEKRSKLAQVQKYPFIYPTREECLCKNKHLTSIDLKYIVARLRQLDLTGSVQVKNRIGSNKNWLYLNEKGDIIESKPNGDKPKNSTEYRIQKNKYDKFGDKIFHYSYKEKIQGTENNFRVFAQYLSQTFVKYKINTCLRKIHFLAQVYVETDEFNATYEQYSISKVSGGLFYRGRGLKQITHDYNYLEYYDYIHKTSFYSTYIKKRQGYESVVRFNERTENAHISVNDMEKVDTFVSKLATSMKYACDAAGWYWNKNNINIYADKDDLAAVSALVNNPDALNSLKKDEEINTKSINGYDKREKYYELFKTVLNYENCK